MNRKTCFKCNTEKDLSEFYVHKRMKDGHLNKCISCTKNDTKARTDVLSLNDEWLDSERKRGRHKYHRLGYKGKHKQTKEQSKISANKYLCKYPEKRKAKHKTSNMISINGNLHHWSYNDEHLKDVIDLSIKHHAKAHRFIIYDQERKMYRRIDSNELLDTKEKHLEWITWCIENKED